MSVYIIAEAGVNHNGDIRLAKHLVDCAKNAGCNCVKFQTFKADKLVTKEACKADYQIQNTNNLDSQMQMLKELELTYEEFKELKEYCTQKDIDFLSSPFDEESVDMLDELGVNAFKIPSGEITNKPLLQYIAQKHKRILLSTGMCTMEEVKQAVDWIKQKENQDIVLFHCTSNYPAAFSSVNMNALRAIKDYFGYAVGYSDHTNGIEIPLMAVAYGAQYIEKHFTFDKSAIGPDHKASLDPQELSKMVIAIRNIEAAFGDGIKRPTPEELSTRKIARKSLVWSRDMKKGQVIGWNDICCKRPGTGILPEKKNDFIGKIVSRDCTADRLIMEEDVIYQ